MGILSTIGSINHNGYTLLDNVFSESEITIIKEQLSAYIDKEYPGIVYEKDGKTVRGLHGLHLYDQFFDKICKNKKITDIATAYIDEPCYAHQFKVNIKKRMVVESWPWHEDYVYWKNKDGILAPKLINICIFVNDCDILSGPLCVIPKSHRYENLTSEIKTETNWKQDLSSELTYQIGRDKINELIKENGTEFIIGNAGDVLIFDPRIAHSSSMNMSQQDRMLMIITYNAVSNPPTVAVQNRRPEFLCAQKLTAV